MRARLWGTAAALSTAPLTSRCCCMEKKAIPAKTPVVTAAVVTPGLIDAACSLGLSGGANVPADQDQDEKSDPNQADLRVIDGFNPDEGLLEYVRREGVTTIHNAATSKVS